MSLFNRKHKRNNYRDYEPLDHLYTPPIVPVTYVEGEPPAAINDDIPVPEPRWAKQLNLRLSIDDFVLESALRAELMEKVEGLDKCHKHTRDGVLIDAGCLDYIKVMEVLEGKK